MSLKSIYKRINSVIIICSYTIDIYAGNAIVALIFDELNKNMKFECMQITLPYFIQQKEKIDFHPTSPLQTFSFGIECVILLKCKISKMENDEMNANVSMVHTEFPNRY